MTNYEKIMSEMTVEKLAELISENTALDNPCQFCAYYRDSFLSGPCKTCRDGIEEWLNQEERGNNE